MTVAQMSEQVGLEILTGGTALTRTIEQVYCCDLLSFVMGRAPADSAWITVMGNVNAMAVALLADVACVILAENAALDEEAKGKAAAHDIVVLRTEQPVFEIALAIHHAVGGRP